MADPTNLVEAPRRRPRKGGVKAVANIVQTERMFASERLDWIGEGCTFPQAAPGLCWGEVVGEGEKTLAGIDLGQSGLVFAGYAGVECVDLTAEADFERRARATLEAGEDRFVEEKLVALLASLDPIATPVATGWLNAIAEAEQAVDLAYVGMPIFVMSRQDAVIAKQAGALTGDPGQPMFTPNGSPVLASGVVMPGTFYVTGDITLWTGAVAATTTRHPQQNIAMALAERAYALGIDCDFVQAYSVTLS